jgi:hypothetical protein
MATLITATPITTTTTTATLVTATQTADTPIMAAPITALITKPRQFVLTATTVIIRTRVRPMATTDRAILSAAYL